MMSKFQIFCLFYVNSSVNYGTLFLSFRFYDFDHQFIPAEKYDATYSYKNKKGYLPSVATISNIPVYIEGRNGNYNVKTAQLSTHKHALSTLKQGGIKPKITQKDSGSYKKEVTDYFHNEDLHFFIRANNSETILTQSVDNQNRKACTINPHDMEVASFNFKFGKYFHRIIAFALLTKQDKYLH